MDPAKVAAAQAFVDSLPTLQGAIRDRTSTACDTPATYCVYDPNRTSVELIEELRIAIKARGAKVSKVGCSDLFGCLVDVTLRGDRVIELVAADRHTSPLVDYVPEVHPPGHVAAVVLDVAKPDEAPLDLAFATSFIPTAWGPLLACSAPDLTICSEFTGRTVLPGSPAEVLAAVRGVVEHSSLQIETAGCHVIDGEVRNCAFEAHAFRGTGGADPVTVNVLIFRVAEGGTRVSVAVTSTY